MMRVSSSSTIEEERKRSAENEGHQMVEVLDGFFVSDYNSVRRESCLAERNISLVINLTAKNCQNHFPAKYHYETFDISDRNSARIIEEIDIITQLIHSHLLGGDRLVVHCLKGISRAPTIAIAYLIKFRGMSFEEAYDFVSSKDRNIDPNAGFLMQLNSLNN